MLSIRQFAESDIDAVAEVHRQAFGIAASMTPELEERYRSWMRDLFVDPPTPLDGVHSLVCTDGGSVIGFLGVVARRFSVGSQTCSASVCTSFCVKPGMQGGTGSLLLEQYRSMPQDFAFVDEVGARSSRLFVRCGWQVSGLQSIRWALPLRPAARFLERYGRRMGRLARWTATPAAFAIDTALALMPRSPFCYRQQSKLTASHLSASALSEWSTEFDKAGYIRPVADDCYTAWALARAASMTQHGELQAIGLRTSTGSIAGWYVYYARSSGTGQVLQLVADPSQAYPVLEHLASDAAVRGMTCLAGSIHAAFLQVLADRRAVLDQESGRRWMLVHSKDKDIVEAFLSGNLLISRLDGEWCLHMR